MLEEQKYVKILNLGFFAVVEQKRLGNMQKLLLTNIHPLQFYFQYDFEFSNFVGPYTLIVNVLMMKQ